ncbi:hypothetical protein ACFLUV_06410 [Elusimicrobiota bacterium]
MRNISKDIKPIGVLKCRFYAEQVNIYGLLLFIFNSRSRRMLRYAAVIGCNPEIYESDIYDQWFSFEKDLYSRRLKDGSLRELTQKIEHSLILKIQEELIEDFYGRWDNSDIGELEEIVRQQIIEVIKYDTGKEYKVILDMEPQELNLRQFKYLTDTERIDHEFKLHLNEDETYSTLIVLETNAVRGADNNPQIKVEKIEAGDMIFTEIRDGRDIGIYLAHLLGARKEDELIPLSATVEDVKETGEEIELIVRYGPGIVGRALEHPKKKVGIIRNTIVRSYSWWYFVILFGIVILLYFLLK